MSFIRLIALVFCMMHCVFLNARPTFDTTAFKAEIERHFQQFRLPGLSVAVVKDGEVIYRQNEGYSDIQSKTPIRNNSIFPIASVTKTFASVMMMKYQEEGLISLDDYVLDYPLFKYGWSFTSIQPNVKLKHFLSHTSEGIPGTHFIYNGKRYNYIYGVFEKFSGQLTLPMAFAQELQKNILDKLDMKSTLSGFPADKTHPLFSRIVTPYRYYKDKGFVVDSGAYAGTESYPSSGILTSIDDLVAYTVALDKNSLITAESYLEMTEPFKTDDGRELACALGWFSEKYGDYSLHWAYGFGDSYSSLLVRVPEKELSFILLCNCTLPSEAVRLGYGNLLQSPFGVSFMKHFVLSGEIPRHKIRYDADMSLLEKSVEKSSSEKFYFNEILAEALVQRNAERIFGVETHRSKDLLEILYKFYPEKFDLLNPVLIFLVSDLHEKSTYPVMSKLVEAYRNSGNFIPEVISDIITFYEKTGQPEKALPFYHQLADSKGYEDRVNVISACSYLGNYYMQQNDVGQGRNYLWKAAYNAKFAGYDNRFIDEHIEKMRKH